MIHQLKAGDVCQNAVAMVENIQTLVTKAGKPYIRLNIRDESGDLPAVLWDSSALPQEVQQYLAPGRVISIDGVVSEYNGKLQVTITELRPSSEDPAKFAKKTSQDVSHMWESILALISNFNEPVTKYVAESLIENPQLAEMFKKSPAATGVHNNWYGGLLEHVYSLCCMASTLIAHYRRYYYPKLSADKVFFGLIFHDAGKVVEYDSENPAFPKTGLGVLANHIVLGPAWVFEKANQMPNKPANFKEERAHLMHLLASHHGKIDWGSPVVPATAEAILVHHLDNLDSKMLHAYGMIRDKPGDILGFSAKSFFEGTPFLIQPVTA